jgi:Tfp pilus assembly protein PilV
MILRQNASARRGITLLEVLTAIFIMGIGLLAILTLFPLGALSMARAVRDDRAAAIAANAAALAISMDLRNDTAVTTALAANGAPEGPGHPVLVDPAYRTSLSSTNLGSATGTTATVGITRVSPNYATTTQSIARWFTFQDEIRFEKTGQPVGSTTSVTRPGTYSWSYLLRRPRPNSADLVELSVIVYASRATDSVSGETTINNATTLGTKGTS